MSYTKLKLLDSIADSLGYNTKNPQTLLSSLIPFRERPEPDQTPRPRYVIGVDFDGTVVTHEFPNIGKEVPYCVDVLKKLVRHGAGLVLFTMRSGSFLTEAENWFRDRGIPLYGVNTNPTQHTWTQSPKAYCNLFIDDANLGCPLKHELSFSKRPYVDWKEVDYFLKHHDYYIHPIQKP